MVGPEPFVVAAVAGLNGSVNGDDEAGTDIRTAPDATADLDVLGGGLGLADDGHEPEAVDVDTDLDDVRGQADIHAARTAVRGLQLLDGPGDLIAAAAAGQLHRIFGQRIVSRCLPPPEPS